MRKEGDGPRDRESPASRGSSGTEDATRKQAYESTSEKDIVEARPIAASQSTSHAPTSNSDNPPSIIPIRAMDWTSLPPRSRPVPTTSQKSASYREGADISGGFDDSNIRRIAQDFADFLIPRIQEMPVLRGVLFDLKVFYFESMEERDLTLVRFELRVPGVEGSDRIALWKAYSKLIAKTSDDFLAEVGARTQKGLLFRKMASMLSEGVVSS